MVAGLASICAPSKEGSAAGTGEVDHDKLSTELNGSDGNGAVSLEYVTLLGL